jgi:hypothetical protein
MRKLRVLLMIILCTSCTEKKKHPVTEFNKMDSLYLKSFDGYDDNVSLVFVGFGMKDNLEFHGNFKIIKNKNTQELPFEKILQVNNNDDLYFVNDKNRKYILNSDSIKTHKFIYIERMFIDAPDSIAIRYC